MKKLLRVSGFAACFTAMLVMLGGHWLVLQSVAWTRMMVAFSEQGSLGAALVKTFDGNHRCRMCLQIQAGREQENRQQKEPTLMRLAKMCDLLLDNLRTAIPSAPTSATDAVPLVPRLHSDYVQSPLTPPPRSSVAVL